MNSNNLELLERSLVQEYLDKGHYYIVETNEPVSLHLLLDAVGGGINYLQEVAYKTKFTDYNKYQGDDDDREDAQFKYAEDLIRQRIEDTISSSLYENEWYQAY